AEDQGSRTKGREPRGEGREPIDDRVSILGPSIHARSRRPYQAGNRSTIGSRFSALGPRPSHPISPTDSLRPAPAAGTPLSCRPGEPTIPHSPPATPARPVPPYRLVR